MAADEGANEIIEAQLDVKQDGVATVVQADVLTYIGPMRFGIEEIIKDHVEAIAPRRDKLLVILETVGGYIEVVERIARVFRYHYPRVEFLVPNYAMSAGTILVLSGDAIHMDYFSILGPIDPQVERHVGGPSERFVPALGYLEWYARLVEKSQRGTLTTAELNYLLDNFDAAELYSFEQERELSIALLQDWLVNHKFKNWTATETRKIPVTPAMRAARARQIAKQLNNTKMWHSHSRGIPMEVLRRHLKLLIDDFGSVPTLRDAVREYYRLLADYQSKRGHGVFVLHTRKNYHGH